MTHIGKIGRLPKHLRDQLGLRIEDGLPAADLLRWLNEQPETKEVLHKYFLDRPISEQNLSDWKQSGHILWLRRLQAHEQAQLLLEDSQDLHQATQKHRLSDSFATIIASEMTRLARLLLEEETDLEKRWQRLCQINKELSLLRRDDHRAVSKNVQQERWNWEYLLARVKEKERMEQSERDQMMEIMLAGQEKHFNAALFGGGKAGQARAEMAYRLRCKLPIDDVLDGTWEQAGARTACPRKPEANPHSQKPAETPAKPQKSSLIKANKAKMDKPVKEFTEPTPTAAEGAPACSQPKTPPATEASQSPVTDPSSIRLSRRSGAEADHSEFVISPSQTESTPIPPAPLPNDDALPHNAPTTNPIIQPSTEPTSTALPCPALTAAELRREAENCLWRMQNHLEPWDEAKLHRLYAAIPDEEPKET